MADSTSQLTKYRPDPSKKLMDQVKDVLCYYHYSYKTEQTYISWIKRYIYFFGGQTHPKNLGENDIEKFLTHMVRDEKVSAATQRQALNSLIFLYRNVLDVELKGKIAPVKSAKGKIPPQVLIKDEAINLLSQMEGTHLLMAKIMYGSGLRLMECVRLRVKDVDFGKGRIYVRDGKGGKHRTTILPDVIAPLLNEHIDRVQNLHKQDLIDGFGSVYLPEALARKYTGACKETCWQYVFPSAKLSKDPRSEVVRRHHVKESGLQKR